MESNGTSPQENNGELKTLAVTSGDDPTSTTTTITTAGVTVPDNIEMEDLTQIPTPAKVSKSATPEVLPQSHTTEENN